VTGVFLSGGAPVTSVTIPAGSAGVSFQYTDSAAGTPTLTASASGVAPARQQEGVTPAATSLAFGVQPGNATAGSAIAPAVTVEVLDQNGKLFTSDTGRQITLSIASGPGGFASGSTVTATDIGGFATFSNLVFKTPGSYTLSESASGGLTGPNSDGFTVSPAGIGQLFFSVQPGRTTAGSAVGPAVQVELFDSFGNALTDDNTDTVTLTLDHTGKGPSVFNDGSNTRTASVSGGIATFSNLVINTAGTYALTASVAGVTGAPSNPFTIIPATASSFAVSSSVTQVTAGTGFNVSIRARDMFGNAVSNYVGSNVKLTCSDGQAVAPGSVALINGRDNPLVVLGMPDTVRLTASAHVGGVTIRSNSGYITINPGAPGPGTAPTAEEISCAFFLGAPGGSAQVLSPSIVAHDAASTGSNGIQISVLENLATLADDEQAAQQYFATQESILAEQDGLPAGTSITTVDPQSGSNSLMENAVGQSASTAVDIPPIVTTVTAPGTPGSAASFSLAFQGTNGVNTLVDTPDAVTVTALDANGYVVADYAGTITLSSTDPQFGQPITYTFTPTDQGSHTFYVSLDTAGVQSFSVAQMASTEQAIASGQSGPLDSSGSPSGQGLVNIMPDAAVSLVLDTPGSITAKSSEGITVTALDALGNVAAGYMGTVTFSTPNGSPFITGLPASYTFTSTDQGSHTFAVSFKGTGSQTIAAYDGNDLSLVSQAQVQVMAAPAKLVIMTQPPAMATAGSPITPAVTVKAVDNHGNLDSAFNGLVTMTLAANPAHGRLGGVVTVQAVNGIAAFSGLTLNKAGSGYTLKATSGTVMAATSRAIRVTANAASEFVVIAQPPSKIGAGRPFSLQVAAEDGYGNVVGTFSGSVTLTLASGPSGAELDGKLTATLVKGVATFTGLKIKQTGTGYSLTASGDSLETATTDLFDVRAQTGAFLVKDRVVNARFKGSRQE
jgi:hypothetical protein